MHCVLYIVPSYLLTLGPPLGRESVIILPCFRQLYRFIRNVTLSRVDFG